MLLEINKETGLIVCMTEIINVFTCCCWDVFCCLGNWGYHMFGCCFHEEVRSLIHLLDSIVCSTTIVYFPLSCTKVTDQVFSVMNEKSRIYVLQLLLRGG
jgi:hypothetical protein